jgi:hypothetical protein
MKCAIKKIMKNLLSNKIIPETPEEEVNGRWQNRC